MHTDIITLFERLWQAYLTLTPSAGKIHALLGGGQPIVNDHIALRTYRSERVGLEKLAAHFESLGYQAAGEYRFEQKKLYARHYQHADPLLPKVFISELMVELCSPRLQQIVAGLLAQVDPKVVSANDFLYAGRRWSLAMADYRTLLKESEYAGWLAAFGFCANHFTVDVNRLPGYDSIEAVNERLKQAGFRLNCSGGEIKGSPEVYLEQSATLADPVVMAFDDGKLEIPGCFYEFARRYLLPDGQLYQGFVEASADKIFESTHVERTDR